MSYLYNKSGQDIFFQREESYGKIYDPETSGITAWTQVPANYTHWRRLDYITGSFDVNLPKIEKIKIYDIPDGKHASAIANGNIEPQDITLEMTVQGMEFLPCAIGDPAFSDHTETAKMTQTITCPVIGSITDLSYFLLDIVLDDESIEHHLFWFDQDNGGTAPTSPIGIADANRHECEVDEAGDADAVAVIVAAAIDGVTDVSATSTGSVVTVTMDNCGAVMPIHTGDAGGSTGCTYAVTTWGSTTYTVTEALDTDLPSFTLHFEQKNSASANAEDIIWDVFGCVVDSITTTIGFEEKLVTQSVTLKCPYATVGLTATNPPPKKLIPAMSAMTALQEADNACLLQEGATSTVNGTDDWTPTTVNSVALIISNNVTFQSDLETQYYKRAIAGKRDISLNIVGATAEKELFNYWQKAYQLSGTDYIPGDASDRINSVFKLQRNATYDYISISIYNWLLLEHNFNFVSVDDAVKIVDLTLEDGSANSSGIMLNSTTFVSYVDRTTMLGTQ